MISREEAREILKDMHDYMHEGYITDLAYGGKQDEAMECNIEALSVAIEALSQPERPKGRWEDGICTNCGKDVYENLDADIWSAYIPPFCPNCGAEMER